MNKQIRYISVGFNCEGEGNQISGATPPLGRHTTAGTSLIPRPHSQASLHDAFVRALRSRNGENFVITFGGVSGIGESSPDARSCQDVLNFSLVQSLLLSWEASYHRMWRSKTCLDTSECITCGCQAGHRFSGLITWRCRYFMKLLSSIRHVTQKERKITLLRCGHRYYRAP